MDPLEPTVQIFLTLRVRDQDKHKIVGALDKLSTTPLFSWIAVDHTSESMQYLVLL
jgi:hypothetical protein